MTLKELAARAGCAASYISQIENGKRAAPPSEPLLRAFEQALGLAGGELVRMAQWQAAGAIVRREASQLARTRDAARALASLVQGGGVGRSLDEAYRSGELRRLIEHIADAADAAGAAGAAGQPGERPVGEAVPLARVLPVEVPLINSVAAGYPTEFSDLGYPARVADDYVRTPDIHDPDAFAARVVGDSMAPLYREGDIVVFSPAKAVKSGMDCFVRIEPDHESTFKRVYFEEGGSVGREVNGGTDTAHGAEERASGGERGMIRLQPLNSAYPARVLPREQVAGMYAAVSVTRVVS